MMKVPLCWLKLSLSLSLSLSHVCYVVVGEALGLFHALQRLSDMQFNDVDAGFDSKITTNVFDHCQVDVTGFRQVISACRSLFNTHFSNYKAEFNR